MTQETPEAKTRREAITPAVIAAGWENLPHSYTEEETVIDGRIIPLGKRAKRRDGLRADYVLRYNRDFKLAVVEAKARWIPADMGVYPLVEHQSQLGTPMEQAVVSSIPALTNIKIIKRMAAPMIRLTEVG